MGVAIGQLGEAGQLQELGDPGVPLHPELPDRSFHDARLFIYSIDTAATFYIDGREIYSWNAWRPGSEAAFAGWPWHAVPLPADSAGKALYVSVYSDYRDIGLWGRLFVSSAPTLYGSIVTRDSPHFVIVIMSLTMMTATVVGIGFTDNRRLVALFLTLLGVVIVAAVASTLTRQFVVDDPLLWFLVSTNVYLAAVALCFLVLSELIRGTFRHILARSAGALVVIGVGMNLGYAFALVELIPLIVVTDVSVVVGLLLGVAGVVSGSVRESKHTFLVITFLLMGAFTLIDILVSYGVIPWFDSLINLVLFQLVVGIGYLVFHRFTDATRQTQELVAANLRLQEEKRHFEHKAKHDQLSGLYNREYLTLALREAMLGAAMQEQDLSIAIFDIDRFKGINDSLGHNVGDCVIRGTAELLRQYTRDTEIVGRYGGDEFLVVFRACKSERAKEIAERLRRGFEEHQWPQLHSIGISVGVAEYRGEELESFVDRADKALYTAESLGRNQVYVFPDEYSPPPILRTPPAPAPSS